MAVGIPGATPLGGHAGAVLCVAFNPDGRTVASGGRDGIVRIWDIATGEQTAQLTGHTGTVLAVAYSPGGSTLAAGGGGDNIVRLWHTGTGQERAQLTGHASLIRTIAYSPDGTVLAAGGDYRAICLWDTATGQQTAELTGHTASVRAIAYSPDGSTLATGGDDVIIRLWDAATGREIRLLIDGVAAVRAATYSPDGGVLATASDDDIIRLWNVSAGRPGPQIPVGARGVHAIAYNPAGTAIAAACDDGIARLWDAATRRPALALTGHAAAVHSVAYSPDGTMLATAGDDRTIRLWQAATGQQTARLTGHTTSVYAIACSADGATIATGADDGVIRLWDAGTGQERSQLPVGAGLVNAIDYSPDGTTLAAAGEDRTTRLWDTATGQEILKLTGHTAGVQAIAYSPDGSAIATTGVDGVTRLWDTAAGEQIRQLTGLTGLTGHVYAVVYSPDGATIATAGVGVESGIRLWDTATGAQIRQLTGHGGPIYSVACSPDGTTLATVSADQAVRLWDMSTGRERTQLTGHTGQVYAIAYSPDGTTLATGSGDQTIRLWDTGTGRERTQLTGHIGAVQAIAYSRDGRTLASAGSDGTIRIWNPRNGAQVNGTGFGLSRARGRPLAGVRSDSPSADDLLGVGGDVSTLAELIAASETRPPLAIALIGDWGAGKSSVMLQVERQINVLADLARNNPGLSAFAENVRHVPFNAWHYSDDNLWAGLVGHLFEKLAAPASPGEGADAPERASRPAERDQLRARLATEQAASKKLAAELAAAEEAPRPAGVLAWLGSPWYAGKVLLIAGRQAFGDVRASLAALCGWVVLGGAAYAAWRFLGTQISVLITAIAVAAPPLAVVARKLRSGHRALLDLADEQRTALANKQQEARRDIRSLQDQLVLIDAAARLARFLDERGSSAAYLKHQGLVGQVRADLEQLSADLVSARDEWAASGGYGTPPLERIVLYIDDLDRCPPGRVVEVLEAVHLMLALDLFVVVVAVDARWLIRSLEYHHRELFGGGDGLVSPIDYLDKIFQIPYVLLPPDSDATAVYLRALLPKAAPAARGVRPGASTGGEAPARDLGEPPARSSRDGTDAGGDFAVPADAAGSPDPDATTDPREADFRRAREYAGEPGEPRRAAGQPEGTPLVDLRPQGLQLSQAEVEFMTRLGGLLHTPRAAKRLVNIYRLVRIGIPDSELPAFVGDEKGGPYQAVQVLLAILAGHPDLAGVLFRMLLEAPDGDDLLSVVEAIREAGEATSPFGIIRIELAKLRREAALSVSVAECQRWCPTLARFSFHTRDLAGAGGFSRR